MHGSLAVITIVTTTDNNHNNVVIIIQVCCSPYTLSPARVLSKPRGHRSRRPFCHEARAAAGGPSLRDELSVEDGNSHPPPQPGALLPYAVPSRAALGPPLHLPPLLPGVWHFASRLVCLFSLRKICHQHQWLDVQFRWKAAHVTDEFVTSKLQVSSLERGNKYLVMDGKTNTSGHSRLH